MDIFSFIFYLLGFALLSFILITVIIYMKTEPYPTITRAAAEKSYYDPKSEKNFEFPSLEDPWTVHLSVIVPAYQEEKRLPPMLDECLDYLEQKRKNSNFTYEVIVVSDGSTDHTVVVAEKYVKKYGTDIVRVLELVRNRGKGGAVRLGMMSARGAALLFADADGATQFSDLSKLEESLKKMVGDYISQPEKVSLEPALVCGSRAHLEEAAIASRSIFRTFLMLGFHFLVWLFAVRSVKDTQCGFKLLTRKTARLCFRSMHIERWAFDVELLYIAEKLRIPIDEVAVNWTEIEGSKIIPVWSWLEMGFDLFFMWFRYFIGAWKISTK